VNYKGYTFKTGISVKFPFTRNTEKSHVHPADLYQQSLEPAGMYMIFDDSPERLPLPQWEKGIMFFRLPLVIPLNTGNGPIYDENGWKANLSREYGLTGLALSHALKKKGFDGIVTIYKNETSEILKLY
jgi:hypothetical protein